MDSLNKDRDIPMPPDVPDVQKLLKSYLHYPYRCDSYKGQPLRKDVYDLTKVILDYLDSKSLPKPRIVLGSRGTVQLEWTRYEWELSIEVVSGEAVIVCQQLTDPDDIYEYVVSKGLPKSLLSVTDWFTW